jgi:outer membrane protein OmpA-like peptidoglycan-associated protein
MKPLLVPSTFGVLAAFSLFGLAGCTPAATTVQSASTAQAPNPAPAMAATPAPEPKPAPLPQPETKPELPATVVLDGTVLKHTTAGWKLGPQGRTAIHQAAVWIRAQGPGATLVVTGYSSSTGTPAQNLAVSRHRAEFIAQALNNEGVALGKITVQGRGAEKAIASNATREGRLKNERVEVSFQNP